MSTSNSNESFMLAGEFCNHNIITVNRADPIVDVARLMREKGMSKALVVESVKTKDSPICVITNHDIVIGMLALCESINDVIKNGTVSASILVRDKDDLMLAVIRMKANHVRNTPVIDGAGELVGILSIDDIFDLLTEQLTEIDQYIKNSEINNELFIH